MADAGGQAQRQDVDVKTIAALLCTTEDWVFRLAQKGIIPRAAHGKYPLVACIQAYVKHLRDARDGRSEGYGAARTNLTQIKAQHEELKLRERTGELVRTSAVEEVWSAMVSRFRGRLLSLPVKAAPRVRVARTNAEARELLQKYIDDALSELSGTDVDLGD